MKLTRNGANIGSRSVFFVSPNDGGFVHFSLTSLGRRLVRQRHHLGVHVDVSDTDGSSSSGSVTLVQFS
jgi:microsomal dipeptidase-like Zn-dependent dipeptidase